MKAHQPHGYHKNEDLMDDTKKEEYGVSPNSKLFAALAKAQAAVTAAGKSGENKFDHYKYATLEDYWLSVQKPMADNGLSLPVNITKVERLTDRSTAKGGTERVVQVELTGYLCHESGESMVFTSFGEGQDRSDKAIYKAVTGGKKYLLASVFNIPTTDDCEKDSDAERGEDMDQRRPDDRKPPQQTRQPAQRAGLTARTPAQAAAQIAATTAPAATNPRPTGRTMRARTAPAAEPLPEEDLPWDDNYVPPGTTPPLPDQNKLVDQADLLRLKAARTAKGVDPDKMCDYCMKEFKKDNPVALSVGELNKLIAAINNTPDLVNAGLGF